MKNKIKHSKRQILINSLLLCKEIETTYEVEDVLKIVVTSLITISTPNSFLVWPKQNQNKAVVEHTECAIKMQFA